MALTPDDAGGLLDEAQRLISALVRLAEGFNDDVESLIGVAYAVSDKIKEAQAALEPEEGK